MNADETTGVPGINGIERSVLNKLYRGYYLAAGPDGRAYYYREHGDGEPWVREDWRVIDRMRQKGLITYDGRLTERGASLVSQCSEEPQLTALTLLRLSVDGEDDGGKR